MDDFIFLAYMEDFITFSIVITIFISLNNRYSGHLLLPLHFLLQKTHYRYDFNRHFVNDL